MLVPQGGFSLGAGHRSGADHEALVTHHVQLCANSFHKDKKVEEKSHE